MAVHLSDWMEKAYSEKAQERRALGTLGGLDAAPAAQECVASRRPQFDCVMADLEHEVEQLRHWAVEVVTKVAGFMPLQDIKPEPANKACEPPPPPLPPNCHRVRSAMLEIRRITGGLREVAQNIEL